MINGKIEGVLNYLKRCNANIDTGNSMAFMEICWAIYGDNNYSAEEEKEMIGVLLSLESQGFIDRVEPKAYYPKALYYLTKKGLASLERR